MIVIDLDGVTRTYHVGDVEVQALAGIDLRVESGEFVALMGASGSGKSTMLNILGCLDRPSTGCYRFEGVDVAKLSEPDLAHIRSERIGFVFQSFNLLARTSAVENVALPLFYAANGPASRSERRAHAWKALGSLGLAARELNTPNQLSGGQQQRVAIDRALINSPAMILADEPTGNLDSRTSKEIMELLRELNRDHGVTIIVVTHDPGIAAYTDRIVTMRDGLVVCDEVVRHEEESFHGRTSDATTDGAPSPRPRCA
jgi:macrolide transport system ATP-binding/permease protein